jgi:hypothetical protein
MTQRLLILTATLAAIAGLVQLLVHGSAASSPPTSPSQVAVLKGDQSAGAVPRAKCGPGSRPEPALQGEVPLADRTDGASRRGYSCDLTLVGQYQGLGSSWVSQSFGHCAYMSVAWPNELATSDPGVGVIDVSDPAHPRFVETLQSPAMIGGTWESLKVNAARGLLGAVSVGQNDSAGFFSVYDIAKDCDHPVLLNSLGSSALTLPANGLGHEGGWAPDGGTYYAAGVLSGTLTAIDVRDPAHPRILSTTADNVSNHGFSFSPDGTRLYLSDTQNGGGVDIFDVSSIQRRAANAAVTFVGGVHWADGSQTQANVPIIEHGVPFLIVFDELGNGGVRFVNIASPQYPTITGHIRLAIDLPQNAARAAADGKGTGLFGYQSHYCTVDRPVNPTALACGWFQSGIRVFDIRNLARPREIAYFNPPAQTGEESVLVDSEHAQGIIAGGAPGDVDGVNPFPSLAGSTNANSGTLVPGHAVSLTADWCSSPPAFVGNELWVTCQDNGFMVLRFTNRTYPLAAARTIVARHHRKRHRRARSHARSRRSR